jgi:hypothetical protein
MFVIGSIGFLGSLLALVLSFFPPSQIAVGSPSMYIGFLIAGNLFFVALPFIIYALRKPQWKTASGDAAMEPFSWEKPDPAPSRRG